MSEAGTNPKDLIGMTKAPLRHVPPALEIYAALGMADGAVKYGPFNWRENKVLLSVYIEAIQRHVLALKDGEDVDQESGLPHWGHVAANVAIVVDAQWSGCLVDDRPKVVGPASRLLKYVADLLKDRKHDDVTLRGQVKP